MLANAFKDTKTRFCVVSFTSDWLYPTRESREIVQALNAVAANVSFVEIESDKGHDAFLLEESGVLRHRPRLPQRRRGEAGAEVRAGDALMLAPAAPPNTRVDHLLIAEMVAAGSRVLDVGCGDGALLQLLANTKNVDGRGIEVARERVNACVARGLSVIQGDADRDLADYPDGAFDYAILSLTIQATRQPQDRAGAAAAHRPQRHRVVPQLRPLAGAGAAAFTGRMPVTENLPDAWYVSPNAHLCTIKDFANLCRVVNARVERAVAFNASGQKLGTWIPLTVHNLVGEKAVFMLTRQWGY